jgi:protein SCO1
MNNRFPISGAGSRRLSGLLIAALAFAALALVACGDANDEPVEYRGVLIRPTLDMPDAVLTDTSGQPYDLRRETDGYLTLLFVGYTNCPDICPVHMVEISRVLDTLPAKVVDRVKVVFITADPERDTPEVLGRWLSYINPTFVGLTGTREQVDQVQVDLRLQPAGRRDLGNGEYSVNHAAYVMAFTRDSLSHIIYPMGVTQDDWRYDLEKLALRGWQGETP